MKYVLRAILIGGAAAAMAGGASAQTYIEGTAGWTTQPDMTWDGTDWEMDDGEHYGAAFGYHIRPNVAVEAEALHTRTNYAGFPNNDLTATTLMANAIYGFSPAARIRPYAGVGIGIARIGYRTAVVEREDDVFAWQAMAGAEAPIRGRVSAFAEYRYQDAAEAEDGTLRWEYRSHNLGLGLRYTF